MTINLAKLMLALLVIVAVSFYSRNAD